MQNPLLIQPKEWRLELRQWSVQGSEVPGLGPMMLHVGRIRGRRVSWKWPKVSQWGFWWVQRKWDPHEAISGVARGQEFPITPSWVSIRTRGPVPGRKAATPGPTQPSMSPLGFCLLGIFLCWLKRTAVSYTRFWAGMASPAYDITDVLLFKEKMSPCKCTIWWPVELGKLESFKALRFYNVIWCLKVLLIPLVLQLY